MAGVKGMHKKGPAKGKKKTVAKKRAAKKARK